MHKYIACYFHENLTSAILIEFGHYYHKLISIGISSEQQNNIDYNISILY